MAEAKPVPFRLVVALASVLVSSAAVAQNYPSAPPPAEAYPWKELDFRTQGIAYLRRVLAYFYEGNIEGAEQTWQVHRNPVRKWYHAPWMHHDKNGREFVRGLT